MSFILDGQCASYGTISGSVFPKSNKRALGSVSSSQAVSGTDWNVLSQALLDTKNWILAAEDNWFGFQQVTDPAPTGYGGTGEPGYLYCDDGDSSLHFVCEGSDTTLGGGGGGGSLQDAYEAGDGTITIASGDGSSLIVNAAGTSNGFVVEDTGSGETLFSATVGGGIYMTSTLADGSSAIGLFIDTSTAWSDAGAKLLQLNNNNVEKAYFKFDGTLVNSGWILGTGTPRIEGVNTGIAVYNAVGGGQKVSQIGNDGVSLCKDVVLKWFNGADIVGNAADIILTRDTTNTLSTYLGTSPVLHHEISPGASTGESSLRLNYVSGAGPTFAGVQRVLVGAQGTGPGGGTTRAIYLAS